MALLVVLALAFVLVLALIVARKIRVIAIDVNPPAAARFDLFVAESEGDRITLLLAKNSRTDALTGERWGLQWPGGYGQIGPIITKTEDRVTRAYEHVSGPPLSAGDHVEVDSYTYRGNPKTGLGLVYEEVKFESPIGIFPGWWIPSSSRTCAVFVHGLAAPRRESLRMIPPFVQSGVGCFVVSYRNDPATPVDSAGIYRYGLTEWEDIDAAVRFAQARGIDNFVLVGCSAGASHSLAFLKRSKLSKSVRGLMLDSPLLSLEQTLDWHAQQHPILRSRLASPSVRLGKMMAERRHGVDWDEVDHLKDADRLVTPILLFHGTNDERIPVSTSDCLAAARPDLVEYKRVPGAGHVRCWNHGPQPYEDAVKRYLNRLALLE
ncbi:MAG TPA: hypothetical protein VG318_17945 [Actinomycetota bacterium]|nr:hypothetical protein [Actinomycetota bacterium]